MKCPNCQFINPDDARFCTKCGQELINSVTPPDVRYCQTCGAPLEPNTNFCTKCGAAIFAPSDSQEKGSPKKPAKEKRPLSSTAKFVRVSVCFLLFDCIILLFILKDIIALRNIAKEEADKITLQLEPISEQVAAAETKLQNREYSAASAELADSLSAYLDILKEYGNTDNADHVQDIVLPHADAAYSSYSEAVQKYVEELNGWSDYADAYRLADATLTEAISLLDQWSENGWTADSSVFIQTRDEMLSAYKEKYIYLFNDLRSSDNWSYDSAWQYMQEAESIGLLDRDDPDDPLTIRYAYTFAGITQKELSTAINTQTLSYNDAISHISSVIETADYSPLLMVDLALYLQAIDDSRANTVINACQDVYNYLAYTENIFINPNDFLIQGKTSSNASSTIDLNDFWYFNDFGEYAPSTNNGVSLEGHAYIRDTFKKAIDSL